MPVAAAATAGLVALATPGPETSRAAPVDLAVPTVHIEAVQLTGIGQDIYEAITPYVQYVVGGVSYLINFIPLLGGPVAAQININYFQGVQPLVEATVDYLAAVVQDPFDFIAATSAYGDQLYGIAYNWVDAELRFLGLPRLSPLTEENVPSAGGALAARSAAAPPPAAAVPARTEVAGSIADIAPITVPRTVVDAPRERPRNRTGVRSLRERPRAVVAEVPAAAADRTGSAGQRSTARAARARA